MMPSVTIAIAQTDPALLSARRKFFGPLANAWLEHMPALWMIPEWMQPYRAAFLLDEKTLG